MMTDLGPDLPVRLQQTIPNNFMAMDARPNDENNS
jgi:hypothetical protein